MPDITSVANPQVKALVALRRRRVRSQQQRTLIEGQAELQLALEAGVAPESVYLCPELLEHPGDAANLARQCQEQGAKVWSMTRAAFERAAYREGPDGVLAVIDSTELEQDCATLLATLAANESPPLLLVCEGVEKPGNLGAMLRTSDAAGAHGVIAAGPVTDWGNPNTVRSSKGCVFSVPVASDSTQNVLAALDRHRIPLVAATPAAGLLHTEVNLSGPVAIAVGAEHAGLTDETLAGAAHAVRIPMAGVVNSLNVSTSAAILLYEAMRQRTADA